MILPCFAESNMAKSNAVFDCLSSILMSARTFNNSTTQPSCPFNAAWNTYLQQATHIYLHDDFHWISNVHACLMQCSPAIVMFHIDIHSEAHKRLNAASMPIHSSLQESRPSISTDVLSAQEPIHSKVHTWCRAVIPFLSACFKSAPSAASNSIHS